MPAIATRTAIEITTLTTPRIRAGRCCFASSSRKESPIAAAVASVSASAHRPGSSPGIDAARVESHEATASTSRIAVVSVKKPRLTSLHRGVSHRNASEPATASASTSAM